MIKSLKRKCSSLIIFSVLFVTSINSNATEFKEGRGIASGVSGSSVIFQNDSRNYVSKGRTQGFGSGAVVDSLTGEVSLNLRGVLNIYLEPQTKLILNRFQYNKEKNFVEIFIQKGEAKFNIKDDDAVELILRTKEGAVRIK